MATTRIYARAQTGSDSNGGTSTSDAVATVSKARQLADAVIAGDPTATVIVNFQGYFSIPSGGTASSVLFTTSQTHGDLTIEVEDNTWFIYGTHLYITTDGYHTHTLAIPSGHVIEAVSVDHEMGDPSHVTSDGRRKLYLTLAADAATCEATANTYFHTGSTMHVNPSVLSGVIVVRYRPDPHATVVMFTMNGQGIRFVAVGGSPTTCGILYPMTKHANMACYGIQFLGTTSAFSGYEVHGLSFWGSWHAIGVLDTSAAGTLEFDTIHIHECEFTAEVIGNHAATVSYNPIVVYSGNTTGAVGSPVYLDITDWTTEDCTFNLHRPVYYDGTSFAQGSAGAIGNNQAQILFSHGGDEYLLPRIYGGVTSLRCTINAWDYSCTEPYFAQRNYQAHTDTPHSSAAWDSYAVDLTFRSRLVYDAAYDDTDYGKLLFTVDSNVRMVRPTIELPDGATVNGIAGKAAIILAVDNNTATYCEVEEMKLTVAGNSVAEYVRVFQFRNAGAGTPAFVFRVRNSTFVQEAATISQSVVWFDCDGNLALTLERNNCLFHSNDTVNTAYHYLIYDVTTAQLPLYTSDPTKLTGKNNWYSNFGVYDGSGTDRDTAAKWQDTGVGAVGPHESRIDQAGGVQDCRYTSAGTWNATTKSFGATDAARTSTISTAVTLTYAPTTGLNDRVFDRHFGADQYGGGATSTMSMAVGIL